ncbi:group II intron maturase-specific domain-containing protein [Sinorhizobium meliloti]|uniref:group II intron maturase-specific domain-containing protein n=1 Tax=Rhizobium meliloti TaxID=382 RepID=UPI00237F64D9|nr:group II intron maturase-specific domain-containing protein [Sinorhizobium meliloti]
MAEVAERLRVYVLGWKAYFRLAQTPRLFKELEEWMRHRARDPAQALEAWQDHLQGPACQGRQARSGTADRGQQPQMVAQQRHVAQFGPNPQVDGCPPYPPPRLTSTLRTARCGPACRVVWQGRGHNGRPLCRSDLLVEFPLCHDREPHGSFARNALTAHSRRKRISGKTK